MSWMFITFHSPEASGVHAMSQLPPAWKTCPGLGVEGVGSASTAKAKDKTKAVRAPRENIVGVLGEAKKNKKWEVEVTVKEAEQRRYLTGDWVVM